MRLYDAHTHLAEAPIQANWKTIQKDLVNVGWQQTVVNGTSESDWDSVLELAKSDKRIIPLVGLHPWHVNEASPRWKEQLQNKLDTEAKGIGEIGLDRSITGYDIERQLSAFKWQLALATKRNLPTSIHCIKAIGLLTQTLRSSPLPRRGFHLHAFIGPTELVEEFTELGAYFSFNSRQISRDSKRIEDLIQKIPIERLLLETDAPHQLPSINLRSFSITNDSGNSQTEFNHPANIKATYEVVSQIRQVSIETLAKSVEMNFVSYFST